MSDLRDAARINDKITHSAAPIGQIVGAVVGAVVGIALSTTGVGTVTIIPLTVGLGNLGKSLADHYMPAVESGEIEEGVVNVLYGPERRRAARNLHKVKCKGPVLAMTTPDGKEPDPLDHAVLGHGGEFVAEGSKSVRLEPGRYEAARIGERTDKGGAIKTGIASILIGGATFSTVERSKQSQDGIVDTALLALDWFGTVTNPGQGGLAVLGLMLKQLGQVSGDTLGKRSPVTLVLKALETGTKIAKKGKGAGDLIEIVAKQGEDGPDYVGKIKSGDAKIVDNNTEQDLPSTPADDERRRELQKKVGK